MAHCDAVSTGEGECTWGDILRDAEAGRLRGIYDGRKTKFDLARSPVPAFHLCEPDRYNRITLQASRGCPHRCEFCTSSILLSPRYKQNPLGNVLSERDAICEIWPNPFVEFADDNALLNKRYWRTLFPGLKRRNVKWFAETDISIARDVDYLDELSESGCAEFLIGLESPDGTGLEGIELNANWKARQQEEYLERVHRIQSSGVRVNGCFILGLDGHGPDIFEKTFRFVERAGMYDVQVTVPTAFPGIPSYDRLRIARRIIEPERWDKCTLFDVNIRPQQMTPDELRTGFRSLVQELYSEESTHTRRRRFREMAKEPPRPQ